MKLLLVCGIAVLGTAVGCLPMMAEDGLVVKTDRGKVEGVLTTDGKVRMFEGVPYAAPPVGELRWKAPQAAAKWDGVLAAKTFGHHCYQFPGYGDMVFRDAGPSEDCLSLNVWTPSKAKKLPVMVWVHGGGFMGGGSSEPRQDGQFLAHRDVVVVSMNYRLGILGFLTLPELTAESEHHASGDYGLMDQAAAIAWVKANIAAFGGDPENITIFGESAGSFSVSALMASPLTKGMLAKAIGESGASFYNKLLPFLPREVRELKDSERVKAAVGTEHVAALRKMSVEDLLKQETLKGIGAFPPDVDGYFLPDSLPNLYAAGQQAHIPLLAGWNADEVRSGVTLAKVKTTAESFTAKAQKDFGADAEGFLKVYPAKSDAEAVVSAGDYASDRFLVYSTWKWMECQVAAGTVPVAANSGLVAATKVPVYRYRFDLGTPKSKALGAFHSDEIEYVFGTLDSRTGTAWRPEDRALSEQMGAYWTNFARTGDPNGPGMTQWPIYGPDSEWEVLHLDARSVAKPDELRGRYLFLDGVWGKN